MNVGISLTQAARAKPDHLAVIYGDVRRNYREACERADRLASALEKGGIAKGDRVGILQHNCPELLESLFGILKSGAIAVPVTMPIRLPRQSASAAACSTMRPCSHRTAPTPFSTWSNPSYTSAGGSGVPARR